MDKSFEGLLISVLLHVLVLAFFLTAKLAPPTPPSGPLEITILDKKPEGHKALAMVPEMDTKSLSDEAKDTANLLSQFTKRVKKEMRAPDRGKNVNAAPKPQAASQAGQKVAGLKSEKGEIGIGRPGEQNAPAQFKNIVIGQSSLAEYIPGIQEGAFTSLNTDQFTYYTFFNRINEQVRYRWISNMRGYMARLSRQEMEELAKVDRHTVFEIVINPQGQFVKSILQNSSGDRRLDQAAIDAFRDAAPFPNPPHGMIEEDGNIHLRYHFVVYFNPPGFAPAG